MGALQELLVRHNESIPLDVAALQIARVEFPDLIPLDSLETLDTLASAINARLGGSRDGERFVQTMNAVLFDELGFQGNQADYYNPHNSCLNEVLARRTGLPITLSVLYIEVSRRLDRRVSGVGLPGHFLVQYHDGRYATYLDPFHGGRLLSREECLELASQAVPGVPGPEVLRPVSKRHIVLRMLSNLRAVYFQRQDIRKALQVLDWLVEANPQEAAEYKQRALLHAQLRRFHSAANDIGQYLRLAPDAEDRPELERQMRDWRRWMAALN